MLVAQHNFFTSLFLELSYTVNEGIFELFSLLLAWIIQKLLTWASIYIKTSCVPPAGIGVAFPWTGGSAEENTKIQVIPMGVVCSNVKRYKKDVIFSRTGNN